MRDADEMPPSLELGLTGWRFSRVACLRIRTQELRKPYYRSIWFSEIVPPFCVSPLKTEVTNPFLDRLTEIQRVRCIFTAHGERARPVGCGSLLCHLVGKALSISSWADQTPPRACGRLSSARRLALAQPWRKVGVDERVLEAPPFVLADRAKIGEGSPTSRPSF